MYTNHEEKIAKAINEDSKRDGIFSYVALFVISLVAIIIGYILWGLISSLTKNMESIASDMTAMRKDIHTIKSIDVSIANMSTDINKMSTDISSISKNTQNMDIQTKDMQKDMHKMNPINLF